MRKYIKMLIITLGVILLSSCISMQQLSYPTTGTDQAKVVRFNYMRDNWSYYKNSWLTGKRVYPEDLERRFDVSKEQANNEIIEFVKTQRDHNGFRRFLLAIYFNKINFYVE